MPLNKLKYVLSIILLLVLSGASYYIFSVYQPKALTAIKEVKGNQTQRLFSLPLPDNSEQISINETSISQQTIFRSEKSPDEIQQFYKSILVNSQWKIDLEAITQDSLVSKYKKNDQLVTIVSSKFESQPTIASFEITSR